MFDFKAEFCSDGAEGFHDRKNKFSKMGLFGSRSSSSTQNFNQDNSKESTQQLQDSVGLQDVGGSVSINTLDAGAVAGGLDLGAQALRTGETNFSDLLNTTGEINRDSMDFVRGANADTLSLAGDVTSDALRFGENTSADALDFGRDALDFGGGALDAVLGFGEDSMKASQSLANSALNVRREVNRGGVENTAISFKPVIIGALVLVGIIILSRKK